jgi:diaminopimelate decarboxylase
LLLPGGVREPWRRVLVQAAQNHRLGLIGDLSALDQHYAVAAAAAAGNGVKLLCAVKASTRAEVLVLAASHGLGFDIANAREYSCAIDAITAAGRQALISLTSPALPMRERPSLYEAFRAGKVARWHCDSLPQLAELCEQCPGMPVGVRVNLNGVEIPAGMPLRQPSRLGIRLTELGTARQLAARYGCTLRWLHMHNASEVNDIASFVFAAGQIVTAARSHGVDLESVDLGGGLLADPEPGALAEFFAAVRRSAGRGVEVLVEPGRFWLTGCISLLTQVLEVKHTPEAAYLVLDMGTMNHLQWSDNLRIPKLPRLADADGGHERRWVICGRSCFEDDLLGEVGTLPAVGGAMPESGDYFVLGNISGYSAELACDFNGIGRASFELLWP